MRYIMLLWPHANARYQNETLKLADAELRLMLDKTLPEARISLPEGLDMPCLAIDASEALPDDALAAIRRHSLLYGLFEALPEGTLRPVAGRAPALVGQDLPAILKYKGKTNEMFLHLLANAALSASDFSAQQASRLRFFDPMCGRGTGLFVAVNRGWDAVGADVDRPALQEAEKFFKRYLEYHRFKHSVSRESRTIRARESAPTVRFEFAADAGRFKAGDALTLSLSALDAGQAAAAFGRNAFHIIACDLPYGVRHDAHPSGGAPAGRNWLETLLAQALPAWHEVLKPGGAAAVSFNAQTFPLEKLRGMMERAGFEVMRGGAYDQFTHWVEQAITRDIAVCRKAH